MWPGLPRPLGRELTPGHGPGCTEEQDQEGVFLLWWIIFLPLEEEWSMFCCFSWMGAAALQAVQRLPGLPSTLPCSAPAAPTAAA